MNAKEHGSAVVVVLLTLCLAGPGLGCRRDHGADQAQGPSGRRVQADELPPPSHARQTTRQVMSRQPLRLPRELAEIRPVARLPVGEQMMVYNAMGPLRLRVARAEGSSLAEVQVNSGEILVVDRKAGVKVARGGGSETLVRGPLDENAEYALFALPIGGARQESERSVIRPETQAERGVRLGAEQELQRQRQEQAATQPSTGPSGG